MPPGVPPQHRRDQATSGPPGATTPSTEVPEAFLPPSAGLGSPVLGDPRQRRARPGSAGEAPRLNQGGPGPSLGDGGPPILSNRRLTGPRLTRSERLEANRLARLARSQRLKERLKSAFAKGVPEGTSPVLAGQSPASGPPPRVVEVPPAMQAPQPTTGPDPHARPTPPADQATRRISDATPAADQPTWEVETPGGPVVSASEPSKQRPDPAPRALGNN